MDDERWSSDLNLVCEQLAERLAADGASHPAAAALCLAVRGLQGADPPAFAAELGLSRAELSLIETGDVAWADLPPELLRRAAADGRLDLARLRPRSA